MKDIIIVQEEHLLVEWPFIVPSDLAIKCHMSHKSFVDMVTFIGYTFHLGAFIVSARIKE